MYLAITFNVLSNYLKLAVVISSSRVRHPGLDSDHLPTNNYTCMNVVDLIISASSFNVCYSCEWDIFEVFLDLC